MAKTGKRTFRDSVDMYAALCKQIAARQFAPVYLLMGEESYFIDLLSSLLSESILNETERAFGQITLYGKESEVGAIINFCRQVPMMGAYQVVIVKEAQQLRGLDKLSLYMQSPSPTTILVLCHKERNMDKRWQLYKQIEAKGVVFESIPPRDYELPGWIAEYARSKGFSLDPKAIAMLTDHLGADIAKITNELGKLLTFLPEGTKTITAEQIEQNIGISKDFNNFELTKALSEKNMAKAMRIADHFARNPKDNPLLLTLSALFTHFQRIFIVNYQNWLARHKKRPMPSDMELAHMLKLPNAFFLKEYTQAAALYPNNKVFAILGLLREYDLKSKGMGAGQTDDGELLKELLLKILLM